MQLKGHEAQDSGSRLSGRIWVIFLILSLLVAAGVVYKHFVAAPVEKNVSRLIFDESVSGSERQTITQALAKQPQPSNGTTTVHVNTTFDQTSDSLVLEAYVPVTAAYATRQTVTKAELSQLPVRISSAVGTTARTAITTLLDIPEGKVSTFDAARDHLADADIAIVPASQVSPGVKLLRLDDGYYLDDFTKGALFRQAAFSGGAAHVLNDLRLNSLPAKDTVLKVNQTGVTALSRQMMQKLGSTNNPRYFSQKIGSFLADADITHTSNEVSFKKGCAYSDTVFCSDPRFIETLRASGVDVVELAGNHNNDVGSTYNTATINLYHSLGWHTFGGGLNAAEAAKPYSASQKGSRVAFLGYNYADSPNSGAIAGPSTAGANSFDFGKIQADIRNLKQQSAFVIVDVQFWECYAYPDGYQELPECYAPIPNQKKVFQRIIDLGADMVVGTQAHQPQTYQLYKGKPIYYGLGNLYFDQTRWPGTEKSIILTHYFQNGRLLQTKLSPTTYHDELQTRLMSDKDAVSLLEKLKKAR
ncbi:MAG TPA: CapA family protein [Candidatus Limnocylindria bacterium]|nr:CapA family protein [Candidatus Limnocylindria bacterium]